MPKMTIEFGIEGLEGGTFRPFVKCTLSDGKQELMQDQEFPTLASAEQHLATLHQMVVEEVRRVVPESAIMGDA